MNPVVIYFSRTGNTKRLAQAIANAVNAPLMDIAAIIPASIEKFDFLILGTPVEGASPAKETTAFIAGMNQTTNAKAILFCTCRLFGNERTMKAMEKELKTKGYQTILKVSKKGMKPDKDADFSDIVAEVKKALEKA
jgi:flavodoxin